ncbi:unnamed protein product [Ilex paraguariensis]
MRFLKTPFKMTSMGNHIPLTSRLSCESYVLEEYKFHIENKVHQGRANEGSTTINGRSMDGGKDENLLSDVGGKSDGYDSLRDDFEILGLKE